MTLALARDVRWWSFWQRPFMHQRAKSIVNSEQVPGAQDHKD